jgi:chorismate mutase
MMKIMRSEIASEATPALALKPYRDQIDAIDDRLVDLLVERIAIVHEVAALKASHGWPAVLEDRVEEVKVRCDSRAMDCGLETGFVRSVYDVIVSYCCDLEDRLMQKK